MAIPVIDQQAAIEVKPHAIAGRDTQAIFGRFRGGEHSRPADSEAGTNLAVSRRGGKVVIQIWFRADQRGRSSQRLIGEVLRLDAGCSVGSTKHGRRYRDGRRFAQQAAGSKSNVAL